MTRVEPDWGAGRAWVEAEPRATTAKAVAAKSRVRSGEGHPCELQSEALGGTSILVAARGGQGGWAFRT